jgi:hypothetical protein
MFVPSRSATEEKIVDLCNKVMELSHDSPEFGPAIQELKSAIHEHLAQTRDKVADLALVMSARKRRSESGSEAAD